MYCLSQKIGFFSHTKVINKKGFHPLGSGFIFLGILYIQFTLNIHYTEVTQRIDLEIDFERKFM